jgi:Domain of unknown function (DUF4062)
VAGRNGSPSASGGLRVFVSHTSELRQFPPGGPYMEAVERAISACGHVIVDMADFPAEDLPPAQVCTERVLSCDVYVGVLGTRYGSPVRGRPELSYTELEFEAATQAGLKRLMFLLDSEARETGIPLSRLIDLEFGKRQEAFRRKVRDSGVLVQPFGNPAVLGQLVERSLRELALRGMAGAEPAMGVLPSDLQSAAESELPVVRVAVVRELARMAGGRQVAMALAARLALEQLADDDSPAVAAAAAAALHAPTSAVAPALPAPELVVSPTVIDLGQIPLHGQSPEHRVRVRNAGGGNLNARAAASANWLRLRQVGDELLITVDTSAAGDYEGAVTVDSEGGTAAIHVLARVHSTSPSASGVATRAIQPTGQVPSVIRSGPPAIIGQQIAAALAGRAAQREFVDSLSDGWEYLSQAWARLVGSTADLGVHAAAAQSAGDAAADVFADLSDYLAAASDWSQHTVRVSDHIGQCAELVGTLHRRVHRTTVNMGVIGQTYAGKSTLLRKLSGLGEEHIPSNRFSSTTATPTRIFHEPGTTPGRAVLTLHSWESFRAEVLCPLHELARLSQPPPTSIDEFRRFLGYHDDGQVAAGNAGAERYRMRLRQARDSLPSYEMLLSGDAKTIGIDELRPYVAYPAHDDPRSDYRPYHAVRSIDTFCGFPAAGTVSLGLIDLPGTGEAGLDVHGRFLADLRNNADLLFIVKRPERAPVTDTDWDVAQLADDAAAGVRRSDFVHQVINRDAEVPEEFFASALARARIDGARLGIAVSECDIRSSTPAQVAEIVLSPVLAKLAERLAYMDRDAVTLVLSELAGTAAEIKSLAAELERRMERWQRHLPDEERRLRMRTLELRNAISADLMKVRDEYARQYESGAPSAELHQGIDQAAEDMRRWLAGGLGAGSTHEWLRQFENAVSADLGRELDHQYNSVRRQLGTAFRGIDASMQQMVDRLWGEVAAVLRGRLTEAIVPEGVDSRAALAAFADAALQVRATALTEATERLLALPNDYGSLFLRVGRPLIRKIAWDLNPNVPGDKREAADEILWNAAGRKVVLNSDAPALTGASQVAQKWNSHLIKTAEQVTFELTQEFHREAQRVLLTLAAATDYFIDDGIISPYGELELERLCRSAQQAIWPADFGGPNPDIAAKLDILRLRVTETAAAATHLAATAVNARRL